MFNQIPAKISAGLLALIPTSLAEISGPAFAMERDVSATIIVGHDVLFEKLDAPNVTASYGMNSKAFELSKALNQKMNNAEKLAGSEVALFLNTLKQETGSKITLSVLERIIYFSGDSQAVDAVLDFTRSQAEGRYLNQILSFIVENSDHTPSQALQSELVLSGAASTIELVKAFKWFEKRSLALSSAVTPPESIAVAAFALRGKDLEQGLEYKLANQLWGEFTKRDEDAIEALKMPLFHTLTKVERSYPGFLQALYISDTDMFWNFVNKAYDELHQLRASAQNTVLIEKGMPVVSLLHSDLEFKDTFIKDLKRQLDLGELQVFRCNNTSLSDLKNTKDRFLGAVSHLAGNDKQKSLIWTNSHGGSNHIWLNGGDIGSHDSNDLANPSAVSYLELANALLSPYKTRLANKQIPALDLSHLVIITDQCIQYDFVHNLITELQKQVTAAGAEVCNFPRIITPGNRGMVSYKMSGGDGASFLQIEIQKIIATKSDSKDKRPDGAEINIFAVKQLTIGDFCAADEASVSVLNKSLTNRTLPNTSVDAKNQEYYPLGQDPAIFLNEPLNIDSFIIRLLDTIEVDLNKLPNPKEIKKTQQKTIFELIEISSLCKPNDSAV